MSWQIAYDELTPYDPPYHYPREEEEETEDDEEPLSIGENMTTEIAPQKQKVVTNDLSVLSNEKIELLKRTFCKALTNDELLLFMHVCNQTGLDPFLKQIYAVKRGDVMTIQASIDGLRLIADRTKNYSPGREPSFTYNKENSLVSATSYIKKRTSDGVWHEVSATAIFNEYKPNYENAFWKNKPHIMLPKCAEALALRKAFPAEMAGVYCDDEMEQAITPASSQIEQKAAPSAPVLPEKINDFQAQQILHLIAGDESLLNRILKGYEKTLGYKVSSLTDIDATEYKKIVNTLNKRKELSA